MAQIHALTPEGRLPTAAVTHVQELTGDALGTIPERTAPIQDGDGDGFAITDQEGRVAFSVESGGAVKIGDTSHEEQQPGYRVMDRGGRVAFEVTADGSTHIYDLATGGGGGQGVTEWHVFVAAGQSNMKGHAQPYGPGMDDPDPRIAQYGVTRRVIETATVPMDFYPDPVGVSPAWFFARHYLATQPAHVGVLLVPCAKGGTGFNDGTGTGGTWDDRQVTPGVIDLYGESITQTQEALTAAGDSAILKGILWHQGESDANRSAAYEEQLDRLIGKYRTDLGNSTLPFVVGQMTPEGNEISPGKTAVDAIHQATPARIQYTGLATSPWGATNYTDTTHFSRTGVEHLGREYVNAYHRALANRSGFGPQQPQGVTAAFVNGTLTVTWGQQPRRVTGYRVEYRIDGGAWVEVTREHPMNLSETITGLSGSVAEVRVTSVNLAQEQAQLYPTIAPHITW